MEGVQYPAWTACRGGSILHAAVAVYGSPHAVVPVYGSIWQYMAAYGSIWQYEYHAVVAVYGSRAVYLHGAHAVVAVYEHLPVGRHFVRPCGSSSSSASLSSLELSDTTIHVP